jgi:carbamoyltransferase
MGTPTSERSLILGIYHPAQGFGHDTGVALIRGDGRILCAHSEERFSRVKMDGGFPFRALNALRQSTAFENDDLDCVAVPYMSLAGRAREVSLLCLRSLRDPALLYHQVRNRLTKDRFQHGMSEIGAYRYVDEYRKQLLAVRERDGHPNPGDWRGFLRCAGLDRVPLVQVDHHLAHAAGAYYTSGWEQSLVVTCDGLGAVKSCVVGVGRQGHIRLLSRTFYPHSPGGFWELVTTICGFHHMKHGGKITGLAAYGNPAASCYSVMEQSLQSDGWTIRSDLDPVRMARQLDGADCKDIAATAQRRLEEVVVHMVSHAVRATGLDRVCLAGGVFANVRLNQRIAEIDGVREVYVYPAMGDEGLAVGAALYAAAQRCGARPRRLDDVYLGPEPSDAETAGAVQNAGLPHQRLADGELAERAASALASGKVIGLYRGRMEFGPRALGHRSILFHTADPSVNDWLNKRLDRTEFMPFAPVTLDEHADQCYGGLAACRGSTRFMTVTCDCTDTMKRTSPAVVHVDGTARPQLIDRQTEPFYYDVLLRYYRKTGVPSLINTSFNMHEEPIVCSPQDAIRAFKLGHLDGLVLGSYFVSSHNGSHA